MFYAENYKKNPVITIKSSPIWSDVDTKKESVSSLAAKLWGLLKGNMV